MRRGDALVAAATGLAALALFAAAGVDAAGDPSQSGAYCPLPEPGQKPVCLDPAEARYGDFFAALEEGELDAEGTARVEADLAANDDEAYLALSSISYAYWQLALRAAEGEDVDPEIAARLKRWNDLLSITYAQSEKDPQLRAAVREAAQDLETHTARADYRPASGLLARLDGLDARLGPRGAIKKLLEATFQEPAGEMP